jgi:hypothetical protein
MFKSLIRFSSLSLVGAAACGIGCLDEGTPFQIGQVELRLATCGSSPDQIRACVSAAGTVRVISGTQKCSSVEKALCWDQVGPRGSNSLTAVTSLRAGDPHCATGGSKLTVGADGNGNGRLDAAEVTGFAYLCNGAPGATGPQGATGDSGGSGLHSLIRTTREPPGSHCPNGGEKIESGLDADSNDVLDDSEVNASQTAYVCNGPCPPGFADCDGNGANGCETDLTTRANCGECGVVCTGDTFYCMAGQCRGCDYFYPGALTCNGMCVWPDSYNCGGCGVVCSSDKPFCNSGKCAGCEDLYPGTLTCNGACVAQDNSNCGTCGNACAAGQLCSRGACRDRTAIGLPTPGGQYTSGGRTGWVWTVSDADGSTITRDPDVLCVTGTAVQVPYVNGGYDYAGAWGVNVGWDLNDALLSDGGLGSTNPADLSGMTSITVAIAGAAGLSLRVQLTVDDAGNGTQAYYCAPIPSAGGTIPLSSLTKDCWGNTGVAFDPATVRPNNVVIGVVTSPSQSYPFDFCVTALSIDGAGTGGTGSGGTASGGGGTASGGMGTGGTATGGKATGGKATGGTATGGVATGGVATGGKATGGKATGGTSGTGG